MTQTHPPYYLVIGLGASGMSMARFLHSTGKTVVATDLDGSKEDEARQLNALGIETQIGFHDQETFNQADTLVPSPGIPITSTFIKKALETGVKLSSELDIFFKHNVLPVIAITGTNGKTTTTTLIGDMLEACGMKAFVGGNIGTPLVEQFMSNQKTDVIVAEVSSFQLDISKEFKPNVGVLLNISEDHLDRYASFSDYENSKWSLFTRQENTDTAIINSALFNSNKDEFEIAGKKINSKLITFSSIENAPVDCNVKIKKSAIDIRFEKSRDKIDTADLSQLSGTHNHENIAAAVLACLAVGADISNIKKGLNAFRNLPHRMEHINTINGISFYNDSKATNTDAVIRAIQCFDNKMILILGGREKGTDFSLLTQTVQNNVKIIIAIGESKEKITDTFSTICPVIEAADMKEAVQIGFSKAGENEIVLLSPACASFDMYESYAHRGNDFINHVNQLKGA